MDVVGLKDAAKVGLFELAFAQSLEGRFLVPEGLEELKWKLGRVECLLCKCGNRFFDLNGVQRVALIFKRFLSTLRHATS